MTVLAKHWYYISGTVCVLCGRERIYRERRFDERPEQWSDRHDIREDACGSHFL